MKTNTILVFAKFCAFSPTRQWVKTHWRKLFEKCTKRHNTEYRKANCFIHTSPLRCVLLYAIISLSPFISWTQIPNKTFTIVPIEVDGRETSEVKAIIQDHVGFMWIITFDGLVRYDGYDFKSYKNSPIDSRSLKNEILETLFVDSSGNLWIGTASGLSRYQYHCDCFDHYPLYDKSVISNEAELPDNTVIDIAEDRDKNIWIAVRYGGLYQLNRTTKQFIRFLDKPGDSNSIHNDILRVLLVDQNNVLWIGTGTGFDKPSKGNGLVRFELNTGKTKRFKHDPLNSNSLLDDRVSALLEDRKGQLWVGTYNCGLHYYESDSEAFIRMMPEGDNKSIGIYAPCQSYETLGNDPFVQILHQDQKGGFWVGTVGKGIYHFDRQTGKQTFYDPAALEEDLFKFFWSFHEDRQGQFWLGSLSGSLYKIDLFGRNFTKYPELAAAQRSCESPTQDDVIWLGTLGDGLKRLDLNTDEITHFKHDSHDASSIADDIVRGLYADKNGMVWIGLGIELTDINLRKGNGGLDRLDTKTGIFHHYPIKRDDTFKSNETVFTVQEDKQGYIWLSTGIGGVYRSDKEKKKFTRYAFPDNKQTTFRENIVYYIYEAAGTIWAGDETDSTLYQYNYDKEAFFPFLKGFSTNYIEVDEKGWYWIGTWNNGLLHVNPEDKSYTHYTVKDGLPNNHSVHALEGESGTIWVATQKGMAVFDTQTSTFNVQGLPHEYFHESGFKTRDGRLIFAGNSALYTFYPDQVKVNPFAPELFLSGLQISGEPYDLVYDQNKLPQRISLSYHQNDLNFEYNGFHYSQSSKNRYKHKLEPFDSDWIEAGTQRTARYTNLKPGDYTFYFMASNSEGLWNKEAAAISIHISPLWWTTWWACVLYIAGFVLLTYGIYRFQLSRKLVAQEAKRLKELDTFKTRFYSNITHEFRTPLTVIQGMANELEQHPEEEPKTKIGLIKKNSRNLLSLVNQMLDLSKLQAGKTTIHLQQADIIQFVKYLVETHESFAKLQNVGLQFYTDESALLMDFDSKKIEQVLTNLISNAIKFTPEYGKVIVVAKKEIQNNNPVLKIIVKDNGIGISKAQLPYIFDRFHQANPTHENQGTGIGLALVKELVAVMSGTITVESELNMGTTFFLNLPIHNKAPLVSPTEGYDFQAPRIQEELVMMPEEPLNDNNNLPILLIIEDNADVTYYLQSTLRQQYHIETARNGKDGIEKAFELLPDIIICDVMMPEMDGIEVCTILKEDERSNHIPIILLTAKATSKDKLIGLTQGADAYLTKPFEKEELIIRLNNLLEIRRTLQQKYSSALITSLPETDQPNLSKEDTFIEKVENIILSHLEEENFSAPELARELHLSRSQVHRKIKALTGMSTAIYIRHIRLQKAKELLGKTDLSISEIAYQTGFSTPVYFSQVFKDTFGESPSATRK